MIRHPLRPMLLREAIRKDGRVLWYTKDDSFLRYARTIAMDWMSRELNSKHKIKGGPWNKGIGILGELICEAILNQVEVPHIRSDPLLGKAHPANADKNYDFKIGDSTIDIKTLPPLSRRELRLNQREVNYYGVCDYYILLGCSGSLTGEEVEKAHMLDEELTKKAPPEQYGRNFADLAEIMNKISKVDFIGWTTQKNLVKEENLQPSKYGYGDYYAMKESDLSKDFYKLDKELEVILFSSNKLPEGIS